MWRGIMMCCLLLLTSSWMHAQAQADESASAGNTSNPQKEKTETSEMDAKHAVITHDFDSFSLILDRNIFDPDRRGPKEERRERPPEPPREESFTLLGTMFYSDKQLAFFEGSHSDWEGAVKLGESIAGHRLTHISFETIELNWNGETIELAVGAARAKRGDDPWSTKSPENWSGSTRNGTGSSSNRDSSTNESAGDALDLDGNDTLRKMMEARKQSLGQ